ncbi:hypothetical protein IKE71_01385 [Candidatus Saccharibacteria bacterium]|nr:hypothetical protein [Candidatus Saccharibacteria bacterium]
MYTYDEFAVEVMNATKEINHAAAEDENLLKSVVDEVIARISLYLNLPTDKAAKCFDGRIARVAARIVSGVFAQTTTTIEGDVDDTEVKSLSDNGQSVTYGDKTKNYLATVSDGELFGGFAELLKPYRKIHVVSC